MSFWVWSMIWGFWRRRYAECWIADWLYFIALCSLKMVNSNVKIIDFYVRLFLKVMSTLRLEPIWQLAFSTSPILSRCYIQVSALSVLMIAQIKHTIRNGRYADGWWQVVSHLKVWKNITILWPFYHYFRCYCVILLLVFITFTMKLGGSLFYCIKGMPVTTMFISSLVD